MWAFLGMGERALGPLGLWEGWAEGGFPCTQLFLSGRHHPRPGPAFSQGKKTHEPAFLI